MDFTLTKYRELLTALLGYGDVILRHDVDLKPENSLKTAQLEKKLGWKSTYYFRDVPESWDESIILQIASMGHEIGYHYESLTTCNGDIEAAYRDFCQNLEKLRALVPVHSICMHGSPKSKWDSRDLWKQYDYHTLGIAFEPYFDMDFSKYFYLTDTGRCGDGFKVSVRDRIPKYQEEWIRKGWVYHTTDDILKAIRVVELPRNMMITTHPQRWTDNKTAWLQEMVTQKMKNVVKRIIVAKKAYTE